MNERPACAGLLISVGGSPNPVAYSINQHRPQKLLFFASRDSRSEIETKVRPLTTHRWQDQEVITTPDHEDLTRCLGVLADELPGCLQNLNLSKTDLVVDYTGGTKTMSAALVLATINDPVRYSYIGGQRGGVPGPVVTGGETVVHNPNPWDVLAVEPKRKLVQRFNSAHFAEARDIAADAATKVGERWRDFFVALKDLCEGYRRWGAFDYVGAVGPLDAGRAKLLKYAQASNDSALMAFLDDVGRDLDRLQQLKRAAQSLQGGGAPDEGAMQSLTVDLVANARATMRLAGRPDDAVARLYSALEKLAKAALLRQGIDNSAARPEQIPVELRDEYACKYGSGNQEPFQFGLFASYRLLDALGDPLGARFRARRSELEKVLEIRNTSLMVHGWKPVKPDTFERLLAIVVDFLGVAEESIPSVPTLPVA